MATLEENKTTLKNANSELYKNVNGERIKLTDSEYETEVTRQATNLTEQQAKDSVITDGGTHADYKEIRQSAYISLLGDAYDQLDYIYHNGLDAWKVQIKTIKDKYPKP
jgi:hypothetical protein|tara:strand:+ start:3224 stop:3550 length:327 start_codon:yes stop_codon:yes gene_type:complete